MFTQIYSGGIEAVEGYIVSVEADVSDGLPGFPVLGTEKPIFYKK